MKSGLESLRVDHRVAVITGGAGFLGVQHAEAIAEAGGIPVLWDVDTERCSRGAQQLRRSYGASCKAMTVDITDPVAVRKSFESVLSTFGRIDILINNAANDPKVALDSKNTWSRLEKFSLEMWHKDLAVGLTGAFICSQTIGAHMAEKGGGVVLNVASDLGVIAPDQRIYRRANRPLSEQPVKPVTYSVIKHGLIGLTKYLATYWAEAGVRVNSISPGGIEHDQPAEFINNLTQLIPMGRMARHGEYKGAVLFLVSDASSYMTGANLIVDGGRTCW